MIENLGDLIFFAASLPIGIILSARPEWVLFILTYGRPERASAAGVKVLRFCGAWMSLGVVAAFLQAAWHLLAR
jgi:hypothetical protein